MMILTAPEGVTEWSAEVRRAQGSVGFVPTMGALHEGHIALIGKALDQCDRVVCSIFVNPLQFNDPADLKNYPRQLDKDLELLQEVGCHALFIPEKEQLFAGHSPELYDLAGLDLHWEGPSRPGHFQGVVNVVERLFHFVRPDKAYFGEKDRQQLTILKHVARTLLWPETIVACPTVRDASGLALSSRNARLTAAERQQATILYKALQHARHNAFHIPVSQLIEQMHTVLKAQPAIRPDHVGIVHEDTLEPIAEWGDQTRAVALLAAQIGPVRLIDNMTLEA